MLRGLSGGQKRRFMKSNPCSIVRTALTRRAADEDVGGRRLIAGSQGYAFQQAFVPLVQLRQVMLPLIRLSGIMRPIQSGRATPFVTAMTG